MGNGQVLTRSLMLSINLRTRLLVLRKSRSLLLLLNLMCWLLLLLVSSLRAVLTVLVLLWSLITLR